MHDLQTPGEFLHERPVGGSSPAGAGAPGAWARDVRWIVAPDEARAGLIRQVLPLLRAEADGRPETPPDGAPWTLHRRRAQRTVFHHAGSRSGVYCKFFNPRFSWRLSRLGTLLCSPAARTVHWFRALEAIGVPVAEVLAAGEFPDRRRFLAPAPSFIVTWSPAERRTLEDLLDSGALDARRSAEAAERLREIVGAIHDAGLGSIEAKPANVLLDTRSGEVVLFDVDRLGTLPLPHKRRRVVRRDLRTLEATCERLRAGPGRAVSGASADRAPRVGAA